MRKIYAYYSKIDDKLYAYTKKKHIAKSFEHERNMSLFHKRLIKASENTEDYFYKKYGEDELSIYEFMMYNRDTLTYVKGHLTVTYYEKSKMVNDDIYSISTVIDTTRWFDPRMLDAKLENALETLGYTNLYYEMINAMYDSDSIDRPLYNIEIDKLGVFLHYFGYTLKQ